MGRRSRRRSVHRRQETPATTPDAPSQDPSEDIDDSDLSGDLQEGESGDIPVEGGEGVGGIDLSAPWFQQATLDERRALVLVEEILREQRAMLSGGDFSYEAEARRDPFRSLLVRTQRTVDAPQQLPQGLGGMLINETVVAAVAQYQGRWYAMVSGPGQRSHIAHVGDALYDGRIIEIATDQVVFEQEVYDGMGARSTRTVTKRLNRDTG